MLAGNLPQLAGSKDEDTIFKAVDAENIPYCRVFDDGKARCSNAVKPPPEEREFHLAIRAGSESDEDMFKAADTNNTGYFTYDQFLVYTNSKNDLPTMLYFNKYVWLGLVCGVIFSSDSFLTGSTRMAMESLHLTKCAWTMEKENYRVMRPISGANLMSLRVL